MIAKCSCQQCSGHIDFPAEMSGQTVECPHCKLETLLFIPPAAAPPKQKDKNTALFVIIGFVLVVVVIGVAAFMSTVKNSKLSAQKSEENLQEVKGAMGWNLGDVLPNNLQVKSNDDAFGITYDFDPPADMEIVSDICYLILTEDRRIAAIIVSDLENKHFNKDSLKKVLTEKYGLRKSSEVLTGYIDYYFGKGERQAILRTSSKNSLINGAIHLTNNRTLAELAHENQVSAERPDANPNRQPLRHRRQGPPTS